MKILFLLLALTITAPALAQDATKGSAYDRVMKAQTIRCGYGTSKPWIWQDMATGKLAGLNVTIMEEVARQMNLELEWPEETGWGELPQALYNGRVDVACSTLWNDPARGMRVAFTRPLFYTALHAWVRADDTRFTGKHEEIDNPGITIVAQDGDIPSFIARRDFAQAKTITIPLTASWSDIFMNVATNKADVVFADTIAATNYNTNNEKKLKKIPLAQPVTVYGNSFAVGVHETALKEVLDTAVASMLQTGTIESLTRDFRKEYPDAILLPVKPY